MRNLIVVSIALFTLLCGCSYGPHVPLMPVTMDLQAKQFTPSNEKAKVYLYCTDNVSNPFLELLYMPVSINSRRAGYVDGKTYLLFQLDEGKYDFSIPDEGAYNTIIDARRGEVIFLELNVATRYVYSITRVPASVGRQGVLVRQMARTLEGINTKEPVLIEIAE